MQTFRACNVREVALIVTILGAGAGLSSGRLKSHETALHRRAKGWVILGNESSGSRCRYTCMQVGAAKGRWQGLKVLP